MITRRGSIPMNGYVSGLRILPHFWTRGVKFSGIRVYLITQSPQYGGRLLDAVSYSNRICREKTSHDAVPFGHHKRPRPKHTRQATTACGKTNTKCLISQIR